MPRCLVALLALAIVSSTSAAQTRRGTWEGYSNTQQGSQKLVIVLDSTVQGWSGAAAAPAATADSLRLVSITMRADTMSFGIPWQGEVVGMSGLVSAGKFSGSMWYNNQNVGTVELTRKAEEKKP